MSISYLQTGGTIENIVPIMGPDATSSKQFAVVNFLSNILLWQIFKYLDNDICIISCRLHAKRTWHITAFILHKITGNPASFMIITYIINGNKYPIIRKSTTAKHTMKIFWTTRKCFMLANVQMINAFPAVPTMNINTHIHTPVIHIFLSPESTLPSWIIKWQLAISSNCFYTRLYQLESSCNLSHQWNHLLFSSWNTPFVYFFSLSEVRLPCIIGKCVETPVFVN